jgi:class 3 adenylate cyclase
LFRKPSRPDPSVTKQRPIGTTQTNVRVATTAQLATKPQRRIVLVSDISLSTRFLLDLQRSGKAERWVTFLKAYSKLAEKAVRNRKGQRYKFIGDGWIDFLPSTTKYEEFVALLQELLRHFYSRFDGDVGSALSRPIEKGVDPKGMLFGAEVGDVFSLVEAGLTEWIGQPINMASRLQGSIRHPWPDASESEAKNAERYVNQVLLGPMLKEQWRPHEILGTKINYVRRTLRNVVNFEDPSQLESLPKLSRLS